MDAGRDWKKKIGAAGAAFEQSLREARERREAEMEPETTELAADHSVSEGGWSMRGGKSCRMITIVQGTCGHEPLKSV
uniref:Uncharacterized protein n=1 Tax=Noccaea caerulescens TaxID=107243 RepID=A0A1J3I5N8_NOCCA